MRMQELLRIRCACMLAFAVLSLIPAWAAASADDPLVYVPADTPFLSANLKSMDAQARKALMADFDGSLWNSLFVNMLQDTAQNLEKQGDNDAANLLDKLAMDVDGKSLIQILQDFGVSADARYAVYGLGFSPVFRSQLQDAEKFRNRVARYEQAYGHAFASGEMDGVPFKYADLSESGLRLVLATPDDHLVIAFLPQQEDATRLRMALGVDKPESSVRDEKKLQALAKGYGYSPYFISYTDWTRLAALIAAPHAPMLKSLLDSAAAMSSLEDSDAAALKQGLPQACADDLARIAARMPMLSYGYTRLDATHKDMRFDLRLAPDIVEALGNVGGNVPGIDNGAPDALLSFGLDLPLSTIRDFLLQQAQLISDQPFACDDFADLNQLAAKAPGYVSMLGVSPFGTILGLRVVLDEISLTGNPADEPPDVRGYLLLASRDPVGLADTAKAMGPGLQQIDLKADGEPVAVPEQTSAALQVDQPAWVVMNQQALALGIGYDNPQALPAMLEADTSEQQTVKNLVLNERFFRKFSGMLQGFVAAQMNSDADAGGGTLMGGARQAAQDLLEKISGLKRFSLSVGITDSGLRINTRIQSNTEQ